MKAAQLVKYGGDAAIKVVEVEKPVAAPGEVIVEVYAAGLNPFDVKVMDGHMKDFMHLPAVLGGDVAGKVESIGDDVTGFEVGDDVYGEANALRGHGSFAEYTPVKSSQLTAKPQNLNFTEAGAVPLVAASAYQVLVDHMNLQAGQKILVHGGAGGIGSLAIQLAKHLGAHVITTASAKDKDFVSELGADEIIDYHNQDFSKLVEGIDAVHDTIGGETNAKSYEVVRPGGIIVSMLSDPDDEKVAAKGIRYVKQETRATSESLSQVGKLFDRGVLKVQIDKVFTLNEAPEALEYLKTSHSKGKVVIEVKRQPEVV